LLFPNSEVYYSGVYGAGDPSALPFDGLTVVSMVERLRVALRLSKGEPLGAASGPYFRGQVLNRKSISLLFCEVEGSYFDTNHEYNFF
jgi:hypothetical protein